MVLTHRSVLLHLSPGFDQSGSHSKGIKGQVKMSPLKRLVGAPCLLCMIQKAVRGLRECESGR
jgi:hypothetical protein